MKNFFRFLVIALLSSAVFAGCNTGELVNPVLLELDRSNMKMTVGQSQQLNAVLKGSDEDCLWKTADASVATVDQNGNIRALKQGTVQITATTPERTISCTVKVVGGILFEQNLEDPYFTTLYDNIYTGDDAWSRVQEDDGNWVIDVVMTYTPLEIG